jgi:proline racemase
VSYGGAFYASVSLDGADLAPRSEDLGALIGLGRQVKAGITDRHRDTVTHSDERLSGLYGVIFHETLGTDPLHQRNVTVFADGEVDRSPCGSGTSARLALLAHHGTLDVGEPFLNEGVAGGVFEGRVEERQGESVITSISGSAYRTSTATFVLDRRDPIGLGFQLR